MNAAGFYTAPNLLAGTYDVSATASGFATEVRSGITLTVEAQQVLNLTLRVGAVTEKVQVAGQAPPNYMYVVNGGKNAKLPYT